MKILKFNESTFAHYPNLSKDENSEVLLKKLKKRDKLQNIIKTKYRIKCFVSYNVNAIPYKDKLEEKDYYDIKGRVEFNEYPTKEELKKVIENISKIYKHSFFYIYVYKYETKTELEISTIPNEIMNEIMEEIQLEKDINKYNL